MRSSVMSQGSIEKPISMHAVQGGPRTRQAGSLRMDAHEHGVLDQMTAWRAGDTTAFTLDGSEAKENANAPPADIQHLAAWRFGDTGAFSFDENGPGATPKLPPNFREGGVGRKVHPAIMPYSDGSLVTMQMAVADQKNREQRNSESFQLAGGSSLNVEAVPREERERARLALAANSDQKGTWREKMWDKRAFALDGSDMPEFTLPANPSRKTTDVTADCNMSAAEADRTAPERLAIMTKYEPKSDWRLGDVLPWTLDGSPARMHENLLNPNQGEWRMGDTAPFRIDGTVPEDDPRAAQRANRLMGLNARKHTDIIYFKQPELTDPRRLAATALGQKLSGSTSVDDLYNGAAQARFGPRASSKATALMDITRSGLSWGEMRRRGMLHQSASDAVLQPARVNHFG